MSRKAMQMALEALEFEASGWEDVPPITRDAISALRQALEEKQEPVAEIQTEDMGKPFNAIRVTAHFYAEVPAVGTKLYKAPPKRDLTCVCGAVWDGEMMVHPPKKREWVGLTDEEHYSIKHNYHNMTWTLEMFARAIEQALKERNA